MSNVSFEADSLSSKVIRFFLLLQIAGMFVVVALCLLDRSFLALTISMLTLFTLLAVVLWLYARFRELPLLREKRELERLQRRFQLGVQRDEETIQSTMQQRQAISQAEQAELHDRPKTLPHEKLESIQQKYQALHARNDAAEGRARLSKHLLEHELTSFETRLQQLSPLTFPIYLRHSLASRGVVAALLVCLVILAQLVSSVSATASTVSSLLASLVSVTVTPLPTETLPRSPTASLTQTATAVLTRTLAPTITNSPSATISPSPTNTSLPAATLTAPVLQTTSTSSIPVSGGCDPAYPGVCIPPAPPDLDCGDVPYRRFQVLSPDPHGFDRDGDGIGCES